jgi:hypothetical protein
LRRNGVSCQAFLAGDSFLVSLFILGFVFLDSCTTGISALGFFVCELLAGDDSGLAEDAASLKKKTNV